MNETKFERSKLQRMRKDELIKIILKNQSSKEGSSNSKMTNNVNLLGNISKYKNRKVKLEFWKLSGDKPSIVRAIGTFYIKDKDSIQMDLLINNEAGVKELETSYTILLSRSDWELIFKSGWKKEVVKKVCAIKISSIAIQLGTDAIR